MKSSYKLNAKQKRGLFVLIPVLCALLIGFQNCNKSGYTNLNQVNPQSSDTSPAQGLIIATLPDETTHQVHFPLSLNGSLDVDLEFLYPSSLVPDDFTWNIVKAFLDGTFQSTSVTSTENSYRQTFQEIGVYDISVGAYESDSTDALAQGRETLLIGKCENHNILEIILNSGTLSPSTSSTFGFVHYLDSQPVVSDILWRVHFNGTQMATGTEITQQVAWSNLAGQASIELFVKFQSDDCITYREKTVDINTGSQVYINYVRPMDTVASRVEPFNNYIYKYDRSSQSKSINIDVRNAYKCQFDGVVVPECSGEVLDMSNMDLDVMQCTQSEFVLTTFVDPNSQGVDHNFYKYCPGGYSHCFFGPKQFQPQEHKCGDQTQTFGACHSDLCTDPFCGSTCINASECNVKDVNNVCLPSCAYAAALAGYGGYGADNVANTTDDLWIFVPGVASCNNLIALEHSDWFDVPILEAFGGNYQPHEVAEGLGVCCVRGNFPTTATTTTTTTIEDPGSF